MISAELSFRTFRIFVILLEILKSYPYYFGFQNFDIIFLRHGLKIMFIHKMSYNNFNMFWK